MSEIDFVCPIKTLGSMRIEVNICIAFLCLLLFSSNLNGQNSLEVYNNTGDEIFMSYVAYDNQYKSWTSHGWYKVGSYKSEVFDFGSYNGKVYIHGQYTGWISNTYWGKGFSFCVDPSSAFEIRFSDKINCSDKRSFTETNISYGRNNYTFNPIN